MSPSTEAAQKPVLLVAAESIVATGGLHETVADVLRGRALRHYGEALRQYATIRLGDAKLAQRAMVEVERRLSEWPQDHLTAEPGARARLFALAREVTHELRSQGEKAARSQALRWESPTAGASNSYPRKLEAVRRNLNPGHAELLELRYARELTPAELAFVVGQPLDQVITELEVAASHARDYLGDAPPSRLGGLRGALQEAFALASASRQRAVRGRKSARKALPAGTIIGDRYAIESRVGEGSFGDVYRALDTDVPGHVVALKLLHQKAATDHARKSALRELRLIASVFHPSVVDFKDHGWHEERLWFVMPWYEGETLEERLRRAPLTRSEARDIFVPLAQALATMHESGIRHQDIKPDNIFLARIGEAGREETRVLPVLIDLGVAAKEAEMIVAGTPLYFAPEIAAQYASKPPRPVTFKADVFSLALSLRNALEPSTQEQVPGTAVEAFIGYRADSPPGPPEARDLAFLAPHFERWLALEAADRPSAEELAGELTVLTAPERRRERRRALLRWVAPMAMGSAVALGSVTYVYLQEREESQRARTLAESTREDLHEESARRHRLEVASAALQQDYAASLMSRDELADKLRERRREGRRLEGLIAEGRRARQALDNQLARTRTDLENVNSELAQKRRKVDALRQALDTAQSELESAAKRHAYLSRRLEQTEVRLTGAEDDLNATRGRTRDLLDELDAARGEALAEQARASKLEKALIDAQQERSEAQRELAAARHRVSELTRDLERARRAAQRPAAAAQPPEPDPEPELAPEPEPTDGA